MKFDENFYNHLYRDLVSLYRWLYKVFWQAFFQKSRVPCVLPSVQKKGQGIEEDKVGGIKDIEKGLHAVPARLAVVQHQRNQREKTV